MSATILLAFSSLYELTLSVSTENSNNTIWDHAQNFSDNSTANLVCRPTKWYDILSFFLLNYIAHAATLKSLPGESIPVTIISILAALFFPASGVFRGFDALSSRANLADTELETAARAGALCTVVQWPPRGIPGIPNDESRRFSRPSNY
jgi:hypothetical protein